MYEIINQWLVDNYGSIKAYYHSRLFVMHHDIFIKVGAEGILIYTSYHLVKNILDEKEKYFVSIEYGDPLLFNKIKHSIDRHINLRN